MRIRWYGHATFSFSTADLTVVIDPFSSGLPADAFGYPALTGLEADLLLVTHEHVDHNGVDQVGGNPVVIRSTPGTFDSPAGQVLGIPSDHDGEGGRSRGANVIYVVTVGGVRIAHFGDYGQSVLRPEQREAIGPVDVLVLPVGGGPTIGAPDAAELVKTVPATWVVPMHYRTPRTTFLDTADAFLARFDDIERCAAPQVDTDDLRRGAGPVVVVPAVP